MMRFCAKVLSSPKVAQGFAKRNMSFVQIGGNTAINPNKITFVAHNGNGVLLVDDCLSAVKDLSVQRVQRNFRLTFEDDEQAEAFFKAFLSGKQPTCVATTVEVDLCDNLTQQPELSWLAK